MCGPGRGRISGAIGKVMGGNPKVAAKPVQVTRPMGGQGGPRRYSMLGSGNRTRPGKTLLGGDMP